MRNYEISSSLLKILKKLHKKDSSSYKNVLKKINEIISSSDLNHYKNLKKPLEKYKRVHVNSHFVLLFRVSKSNIVFEDYDHHDKIYLNK